MRSIVVCFALMIGMCSIAQEGVEPDPLALQQKIDSFAVMVQEHSVLLEHSTAIDSIHALANELQERSAVLIEETEQVYPIDETLKFEVELNNVPQLDMDPAISLEYQQRAHSAQQKIDAMMPAYYKILRRINVLTARMGNVRKPEKAHKLNEDLKDLDLMVRDVDD